MDTTSTRFKARAACLWRGIGLAAVLGITLAIALNRDKMKDFEAMGYAGAFFAMLGSNATLVLPAPGLVIVFALGSSLNPLVVGVCGAAGATLGELTGYMTGYSGLAALDQTRAARRIESWMNRNGVLTIFLLSIIPNPFFDIAGILAGAGRIPVWKFEIVAFGGKLIQSCGIALAGALSLHWIEPLLTH
jgi:uncharacterized membrane protein YdjX (TVP38/TMEM64 family)